MKQSTITTDPPAKPWDSKDAASIVAWAKRHPSITQAWQPTPSQAALFEEAHDDLKKLWPGHFTITSGFIAKMRAVVQREQLHNAPLALIPCDSDQMTDGQVYLGVDRGLSVMIVEVHNGRRTCAKHHRELFRIAQLNQRQA